MTNKDNFLQTYYRYQEVGITKQLNYEKFNRLSLIAHSASMEGSTLSDIECQLLIDEKIPAKGKSEEEQFIVLDLNNAYDFAIQAIQNHIDFSLPLLKELAAKVMEHTGQIFNGESNSFNSQLGEYRCIDITAGVGGCSYPSYKLIRNALEELCNDINSKRKELLRSGNPFEQYLHTFNTCFLLESIHPWAEGNGRMARLVMNVLQQEYGLTPNKVLRENKAEYLHAFLRAKNENDPSIFSSYLLDQHERDMNNEIDKYLYDNGLNPIKEYNEPQTNFSEPHDLTNNEPLKNTNEPRNEPQTKYNFLNEPQEDPIEVQILESIQNNDKITREELAQITGTSLSTIKRRLKNMSNQIKFVGSGYSGHWEII